MKAFPRCDGKFDSSKRDELGMDLRDYFAAKAMQGLIINLDLRPNTHNVGIVGTNVGMNIGAFSYWMADAMMKARENRE